MSGNPRKFSEKIALQQQKLVEQQREFDAVMREVEATKNKGSPPALDAYSTNGVEFVPGFPNPIPATDFSVAAINRGIDLPEALRSLQTLTHGPNSLDGGPSGDGNFILRPTDSNPSYYSVHGTAFPPAVSGIPQNFPNHPLPFNPPQPLPFLRLPQDSNWVRSQSDSSLHATVMGGGYPIPTASGDGMQHLSADERRKQLFHAKTRSPAQRVSDCSAAVPYVHLEPRMASLTVEPAPVTLPGPAVMRTFVDTNAFDSYASDGLRRYDSASAVFPANSSGKIHNHPVVAPQITQAGHQNMTMPTMSSGYDPSFVVSDTSDNLMRPPPDSVVGGSLDSTYLLNTNSMPDLRAVLAAGTVLPNGFPVKEQSNDLVSNARLPGLRVHKRALRAHLRQSVFHRNSPNLTCYNGGRSVSHADMAALVRQPDLLCNSRGIVGANNSGPIVTAVEDRVSPIGRYQPLPPQQLSKQQPLESVPNPSSSYATFQSPQPVYKMYPDPQRAAAPMGGVNQSIPEICIETAEDHISQRNQVQQFSPDQQVANAVYYDQTVIESEPTTVVMAANPPVTVYERHSPTQQQIYVSQIPDDSQSDFFPDWAN